MKAFDVSKFRKSVTKSVQGMSVGFRDPDTWISTGNYTLNKLISGDFNRGIPLGKVTVFAGESGSGKSFLASGNIIRTTARHFCYLY
jgi:RecA/RadA recombinase